MSFDRADESVALVGFDIWFTYSCAKGSDNVATSIRSQDMLHGNHAATSGMGLVGCAYI